MPKNRMVIDMAADDIKKISKLQDAYSKEIEQKDGVQGFNLSPESVIRTAIHNEYMRVKGKR